MMYELKSCPFCGGKAFFDKLYSREGEDEYCIACEDCDCVFTAAWCNPSEGDLAELWNRRCE